MVWKHKYLQKVENILNLTVGYVLFADLSQKSQPQPQVKQKHTGLGKNKRAVYSHQTKAKPILLTNRLSIILLMVFKLRNNECLRKTKIAFAFAFTFVQFGQTFHMKDFRGGSTWSSRVTFKMMNPPLYVVYINLWHNYVCTLFLWQPEFSH